MASEDARPESDLVMEQETEGKVVHSGLQVESLSENSGRSVEDCAKIDPEILESGVNVVGVLDETKPKSTEFSEMVSMPKKHDEPEQGRELGSNESAMEPEENHTKSSPVQIQDEQNNIPEQVEEDETNHDLTRSTDGASMDSDMVDIPNIKEENINQEVEDGTMEHHGNAVEELLEAPITTASEESSVDEKAIEQENDIIIDEDALQKKPGNEDVSPHKEPPKTIEDEEIDSGLASEDQTTKQEQGDKESIIETAEKCSTENELEDRGKDQPREDSSKEVTGSPLEKVSSEEESPSSVTPFEEQEAVNHIGEDLEDTVNNAHNTSVEETIQEEEKSEVQRTDDQTNITEEVEEDKPNQDLTSNNGETHCKEDYIMEDGSLLPEDLNRDIRPSNFPIEEHDGKAEESAEPASPEGLPGSQPDADEEAEEAKTSELLDVKDCSTVSSDEIPVKDAVELLEVSTPEASVEDSSKEVTRSVDFPGEMASVKLPNQETTKTNCEGKIDSTDIDENIVYEATYASFATSLEEELLQNEGYEPAVSNIDAECHGTESSLERSREKTEEPSIEKKTEDAEITDGEHEQKQEADPDADVLQTSNQMEESETTEDTQAEVEIHDKDVKMIPDDASVSHVDSELKEDVTDDVTDNASQNIEVKPDVTISEIPEPTIYSNERTQESSTEVESEPNLIITEGLTSNSGDREETDNVYDSTMEMGEKDVPEPRTDAIISGESNLEIMTNPSPETDNIPKIASQDEEENDDVAVHAPFVSSDLVAEVETMEKEDPKTNAELASQEEEMIISQPIDDKITSQDKETPILEKNITEENTMEHHGNAVEELLEVEDSRLLPEDLNRDISPSSFAIEEHDGKAEESAKPASPEGVPGSQPDADEAAEEAKTSDCSVVTSDEIPVELLEVSTPDCDTIDGNALQMKPGREEASVEDSSEEVTSKEDAEITDGNHEQKQEADPDAVVLQTSYQMKESETTEDTQSLDNGLDSEIQGTEMQTDAQVARSEVESNVEGTPNIEGKETSENSETASETTKLEEPCIIDATQKCDDKVDEEPFTVITTEKTLNQTSALVDEESCTEETTDEKKYETKVEGQETIEEPLQDEGIDELNQNVVDDEISSVENNVVENIKLEEGIPTEDSQDSSSNKVSSQDLPDKEHNEDTFKDISTDELKMEENLNVHEINDAAETPISHVEEEEMEHEDVSKAVPNAISKEGCLNDDEKEEVRELHQDESEPTREIQNEPTETTIPAGDSKIEQKDDLAVHAPFGSSEMVAEVDKVEKDDPKTDVKIAGQEEEMTIDGDEPLQPEMEKVGLEAEVITKEESIIMQDNSSKEHETEEKFQELNEEENDPDTEITATEDPNTGIDTKITSQDKEKNLAGETLQTEAKRLELESTTNVEAQAVSSSPQEISFKIDEMGANGKEPESTTQKCEDQVDEEPLTVITTEKTLNQTSPLVEVEGYESNSTKEDDFKSEAFTGETKDEKKFETKVESQETIVEPEQDEVIDEDSQDSSSNKVSSQDLPDKEHNEDTFKDISIDELKREGNLNFHEINDTADIPSLESEPTEMKEHKLIDVTQNVDEKDIPAEDSSLENLCNSPVVEKVITCNPDDKDKEESIVNVAGIISDEMPENMINTSEYTKGSSIEVESEPNLIITEGLSSNSEDREATDNVYDSTMERGERDVLDPRTDVIVSGESDLEIMTNQSSETDNIPKIASQDEEEAAILEQKDDLAVHAPFGSSASVPEVDNVEKEDPKTNAELATQEEEMIMSQPIDGDEPLQPEVERMEPEGEVITKEVSIMMQDRSSKENETEEMFKEQGYMASQITVTKLNEEEKDQDHADPDTEITATEDPIDTKIACQDKEMPILEKNLAGENLQTEPKRLELESTTNVETRVVSSSPQEIGFKGDEMGANDKEQVKDTAIHELQKEGNLNVHEINDAAETPISHVEVEKMEHEDASKAVPNTISTISKEGCLNDDEKEEELVKLSSPTKVRELHQDESDSTTEAAIPAGDSKIEQKEDLAAHAPFGSSVLAPKVDNVEKEDPKTDVKIAGQEEEMTVSHLTDGNDSLQPEMEKVEPDTEMTATEDPKTDTDTRIPSQDKEMPILEKNLAGETLQTGAKRLELEGTTNVEAQAVTNSPQEISFKDDEMGANTGETLQIEAKRLELEGTINAVAQAASISPQETSFKDGEMGANDKEPLKHSEDNEEYTMEHSSASKVENEQSLTEGKVPSLEDLLQTSIHRNNKDSTGENEAKEGDEDAVIVEASRDVDIKTTPKKSNNILSGVGSKVKNSIAKVKKVITGKSASPKPSSPT